MSKTHNKTTNNPKLQRREQIMAFMAGLLVIAVGLIMIYAVVTYQSHPRWGQYYVWGRGWVQVDRDTTTGRILDTGIGQAATHIMRVAHDFYMRRLMTPEEVANNSTIEMVGTMHGIPVLNNGYCVIAVQNKLICIWNPIQSETVQVIP